MNKSNTREVARDKRILADLSTLSKTIIGILPALRRRDPSRHRRGRPWSAAFYRAQLSRALQPVDPQADFPRRLRSGAARGDAGFGAAQLFGSRRRESAPALCENA